MSQLASGIAKKMIVTFFGLQKPKFKRKIVRKIIVFLTCLFKSIKFQSIFK